MDGSILTVKRIRQGVRLSKRRRKISSRRPGKKLRKIRRPVRRNRTKRRPKKRNPKKNPRKPNQNRPRAMMSKEVRCETPFPERLRRDDRPGFAGRARNKRAIRRDLRLRDYARKNIYAGRAADRRRHGCDS